MNTRVKVTKKQVAALVNASFPQYRGRTFFVEFTESVTFYNTNWGGGSRNQYHGLSNHGQARLHVDAPWNNPIEGKRVDLPQDVVIVCRSVFCGKEAGLTIYTHPTNAPKWLPAGM